ncbi:fimbria/pilus outer membrane usher protein [Chromobacterium haemolyticum]|uniref:fimbria/pilus outer membrane usher protein n=1 Tax=Chromobacterium TaxID=535 RepID=UPI00405782D2
MKPAHRKISACLIVFACGDASARNSPPQAENKQEAVIFNDVFLFGSDKVDVSRFATETPIEPGLHRVELYVNNVGMQTRDILFVKQPGQSNAYPCFSQSTLQALGVAVEKFNADQKALFSKADDCVAINSLWPDASSEYDSAQQRLNLSLPQMALSRRSRGYVDPSQWDTGLNVAFANYRANTYYSELQGGGSSRSDYLNLTGGINLAGVQFRSEASYTGRSNGDHRWQSVRSYLQGSLPNWQSRYVVGQAFTSGRYFDAVGFTGVELSRDERMVPDSERGYAPVVRGVAMTQAKVAVRQGSYLLFETSVPPGPFEFDDLYPTGYGGDLQVEITEADGKVRVYSIPYSAVPDMLREGVSRYSLTAGQLRDPSIRSQPYFAQLSYSVGVNSFVTAYGAGQLAQNYASGLLGVGWNTFLGAISADVTSSQARLWNGEAYSGMSFKLSHSYRLTATDTSFSLAAYRYSTERYLSLRDFAYANDSIANRDMALQFPRQKNRFDITMSQALGSNGQLYLSGSTQTQWAGSGRSTQYQLGYSGSYKHYNFTASIGRTLNDANQAANQLFVGVTIPFDHSSGSKLNSVSSVSSNGGDFTLQTALNGNLPQDDSVTLGAYAGYDSQGRQSNWGANAQKQFSSVNLQGSLSQSGSYKQYSAGAAGSVVAHRGGLSFGQSLGESFAIVEAPGAAGAGVLNTRNVQVDSRGFAIVPYLTPFRMNEVALSPEGMGSEIELKQTSKMAVPLGGAVVHVKFETQSGRSVLLELQQASGNPLPIGSDVLDEGGAIIGVVGQGSRAYFRASADHGRLTIKWGEQLAQRCVLDYDLAHAENRGALALASAICAPEKVN